MAQFKKDWTDLILAYEGSEERQQGEGGSFDEVLQFLKNQTDVLSFEEVAETMIEIIFTNIDVLQPALAWILADMVVYPQFSS